MRHSEEAARDDEDHCDEENSDNGEAGDVPLELPKLGQVLASVHVQHRQDVGSYVHQLQ